MAYTTNPHLPRVRYEAVKLVRSGWSVRKTARHLGFAHNTVLNWIARAPQYGRYNRLIIPTRSSRPCHHPRELPLEIVARILAMRRERRQCAEILHHQLVKEGVVVSLSSVKRTLKRYGLTYPSKWKKWHTYPPRPQPEKPGILVEIDSMQEGLSRTRLHAYALVDLCSRWAYAFPCPAANTHTSLRFVEEARGAAPFPFATIQSDHGSEFSKWLTKRLGERGMAHRHSRVRTPTDNAHVERFILTLQRECLKRVPSTLSAWQRAVPEYLRYYNEERPHMSLNYQTPLQVVRSY